MNLHTKARPLTVERQEDILDLLCEEYDYRGVSYEVVMNSRLSVQMACPRCSIEGIGPKTAEKIREAAEEAKIEWDKRDAEDAARHIQIR